MFSKCYRLSGKPDYITKLDNHYIPVEVKTGHHNFPLENHILQLAAYCQIIEDTYNDFVPYGILVYSDTSKQFKISFDPMLRFKLESNLKYMRDVLKKKKVKRNHNDQNKCKHCSMRNYCSEKLI